jgi:hypothetical protein
MIALLYRRPIGASETPYSLRLEEPVVMLDLKRSVLYRRTAWKEVDKPEDMCWQAAHPVVEYGSYLPDRDILVPVVSPEMTEALAAHDRLKPEVAETLEAEQIAKERVETHPLYLDLLKEFEDLYADHEVMRQELLDGEKLYGVDAIFSYYSECEECGGTGSGRLKWDSEECWKCDGSGQYHRLITREPGSDEEDGQLAGGTDLSTVWHEAMTEARSRGWKYILTPERERKAVAAPHRLTPAKVLTPAQLLAAQVQARADGLVDSVVIPKDQARQPGRKGIAVLPKREPV